MSRHQLKKVLENLIDENEISYDKRISKFSKIHKYWSRKPWYIIQSYINKYSSENEIVLDPFCGSGVVGLESSLLNRSFIGYDLNPIAIFITKLTIESNFDLSTFEEEIRHFEKELKKKIMKLYEVDNSNYTLYNIVGDKNIKDYNSVVSDFDFKNKQKVNLVNLLSAFKLPKGVSYPDEPFPKKFYKDRFSYKGVNNVSDLFSKRNLYALTLINDYVENTNLKNKDLFKLALSNTLLHVSKLKGENVRPLGVNNYWIPDDYIEENVIWRFLDRIKNVKDAKHIIQQRFNSANIKNQNNILYNKSSLELSEIESNSVDYVITDPPYGDAIQYSELSFVWNTWLGESYKINQEVIINPAQSKGISEFHESIFSFLSNIYRVLKNEKYFTLCFQNKDVKIWIAIIEKIRNLGFELHDIKIYDVFGSPYNKHWAKFSPKSDLYVTFKKSKIKAGKGDKSQINVSAIINDIISFLCNKNNDNLDLNIAFDLFVSIIIQEIFENKSPESIKNLDLKKIIKMFEVNYGIRTQGSN
jgi:adenine-specific DNA methylase